MVLSDPVLEMKGSLVEYREFSLGEVLFLATGGRVVSPLHRHSLDGIRDILSYMTGFSVADISWLAAARLASDCQAHVLAQHSWLAGIADRINTELDPLLTPLMDQPAEFDRAANQWLDQQHAGPIMLMPVHDSPAMRN